MKKTIILSIIMLIMTAAAVIGVDPTKVGVKVNNITAGANDIAFNITQTGDCNTPIFTENYPNNLTGSSFSVLLGDLTELSLNYEQDYTLCTYIDGSFTERTKFRSATGEIPINSLENNNIAFTDQINTFTDDQIINKTTGRAKYICESADDRCQSVYYAPTNKRIEFNGLSNDPGLISGQYNDNFRGGLIIDRVTDGGDVCLRSENYSRPFCVQTDQTSRFYGDVKFNEGNAYIREESSILGFYDTDDNTIIEYDTFGGGDLRINAKTIFGGNINFTDTSKTIGNLGEMYLIGDGAGVTFQDGHEIYGDNGELTIKAVGNGLIIDSSTIQIGTSAEPKNIKMFSPNGSEFNCGVSNAGVWSCS